MSPAKSDSLCPKCGAPIPHLTFVCAFCGVALSRQDKVEAKSEPDKTRPKSDGKSRAKGSSREFQEPDTPEELVAFFSDHIGGVATQSRKTEQHKQACEGALTKLKVFSANDSRLAQITLDLQDQYHAACAKHKRSKFWLNALGAGALVLFFAFAGFMAFNETSGHAKTREDIQRLIGEGKFSEARIRAQGLRSGSTKNEMLQAIDRAESISKKNSK